MEKYAVVTGATKGIGRAITERLLREGYCVVGNYAHDDAAAQAMAADNAAYGERLTLVKCALCSDASAADMAESVCAHIPALDVLVCNSGTTDPTPFGELTPQAWSRVLDTNLNAPALLCQRLLPQMGPGANILFIGSILGGGVYPHARSASYGVSKAMVAGLAVELGRELEPRDIRVNCIEPGFIDTPWQAGKAPEHRKRIEDKIALHRFGRPEEVAELCMNIINSGVTGATIAVDGGYCFA